MAPGAAFNRDGGPALRPISRSAGGEGRADSPLPSPRRRARCRRLLPAAGEAGAYGRSPPQLVAARRALRAGGAHAPRRHRRARATADASARPRRGDGDHRAGEILGMATRLLVFDSGIGGLSVAREVGKLLPAAEMVYVADDAAFP